MVNLNLSCLRLATDVRCQNCVIRFAIRGLRRASTTTDAPPPLLSKIKDDLKTAMRAKDTARLNVLRAIISETNQLSSGPSPIKSDLQILAMLRKRKAASQAAAKEAEQVKRDDLKLKQEKEIEILDDYAGKVQLVPESELREAVQTVIASLGEKKMQPGIVMKELLQPGGVLEGKPVENSQLAVIVREILNSKPQTA